LFKANPMPNFDKRKFTLKLSEKKLTKIQGPNLNVASRAASRLRKEQDKDVNSENSALSQVPQNTQNPHFSEGGAHIDSEGI